MRAFIGIPISENVKEGCSEIENQLSQTGIKMKLVEPDNIHITLKFLGDISEKQAERITHILDKINMKPFIARTTRIGVFPNMSYIRVVWLGVESKELVDLALKVDKELETLGFTRENRFVPHITLARIKGKPNKNLFELIGNEVSYKFKIDEIDLVKSILSRSGPEYEILHRKILE